MGTSWEDPGSVLFGWINGSLRCLDPINGHNHARARTGRTSLTRATYRMTWVFRYFFGQVPDDLGRPAMTRDALDSGGQVPAGLCRTGDRSTAARIR